MYKPSDYHGIIPLNAVPMKDKDLGDDLYHFIKSNKVKCLGCGEIIESRFQHDFKQCKCGKTFVDGGLSYLRRGFDEKVGFDDMSVHGVADEKQYQEWKDAHEQLKEYKEQRRLKFLQELKSIWDEDGRNLE